MTLACFVTGTDTGIGKTHTCCALLRAAAVTHSRCLGVKPIAAGTELIDGALRNEDVEQLRAASTIQLAREQLTPYLFDEAIAPHIAAAHTQQAIELEPILRCVTHACEHADLVVVEGVGGFHVPLGNCADAPDTAMLAQALNLPVIMVVGMRLGCLNHALLTAESIAARGLKLCGWVANTLTPDMPAFAENLSTLQSLLPMRLLGVLPYAATPHSFQASQAATNSLSGWTHHLTS